MCKLAKLKTNFNTEISVAENKLSVLNNLISIAALCPKIDAIMLFGSALEDRCTAQSDVDLVIISRDTITALSKYKTYLDFQKALYLHDMSQEYDFLYFRSLDEIEARKSENAICRELSDKGKVIYRRPAA